ncbi:hypothetical protein GCM10010191_08440 [Actinomadura vinacea]|uniref:Aldehyde oxidase/xanthine dehydrogenase a/b hammerhead domain-containing protein n=1 Tax=Actinomadura vinacea TaxID=115336 RepID=A0ABN3IGJ6_9ACTN
MEDGRLLTGHGTFVDDISRPGMLHACFVRSPIARARVTRVDTSQALELPGVQAVFLAGDLNPDVREQWYTSLGRDAGMVWQPLASDEVRAFCSRLLGLPEHSVRVIMRDTGGGFGQKVVPQREEMCVMLAARKVPVAIKWIEDRRENLMAAGQARHEHGRTRMAFSGDGPRSPLSARGPAAAEADP